MDPFFPFSRGVNVPVDFVPFRKIDLDFGCSITWNTQHICFEFFNQATDPFPPLFLGFLLADCQPQCVRVRIFRRVCIPIEICNFDIREDANNNTTKPYSFL